MERKLLLLLSVLIFVGCCWLLASGSWLLELPLFFAKNIPLGTVTTWAGLVALPCIIFYAIREFHPAKNELLRVFRTINMIIIFLAFCWGIVSYFLAGNWSFSFSGFSEGFRGSDRAFILFQQYTIFSIILPLVFFLTFIITKRLYKNKPSA